MINSSRVISVVTPDSAPTKRIVQEAKENKMLIDATCGRRTKSVIVADSDHIILSYLSPDKLYERFEASDSFFFKEASDSDD